MKNKFITHILYFILTPLRMMRCKKWRGLFHYFFPFPKGYHIEFIEGQCLGGRYRWVVNSKIFSSPKYHGYIDTCVSAWEHDAKTKELGTLHNWFWENRVMLLTITGIITILIKYIDCKYIEHRYATSFEVRISISYFCFMLLMLYVIKPKNE